MFAGECVGWTLRALQAFATWPTHVTRYGHKAPNRRVGCKRAASRSRVSRWACKKRSGGSRSYSGPSPCRHARKRPHRRGADQKGPESESYTGGVSARGRHQITDRADNLTGAIWLGQEATTGRQMLFAYIAQAGRGYDLDRRPASPDRGR